MGNIYGRISGWCRLTSLLQYWCTLFSSLRRKPRLVNNDMIKQYIQSNQQRFLDELFDLLRIPSVSADSRNKGDVRKAAEFIVKKLKQAGAESVELFETKGHPISFDEKKINSSLPTFLISRHFYMH